MSKKVPKELAEAISPFTEGLQIPIYGMTKVEQRIDPTKIKIVGGAITNVGMVENIKKSFFVEKDRKIHIYYENDKGDLRGYYKRLTKEGRLLLEYIMFYCLRRNKLYCFIDSNEFMELYDVTSRTSFWAYKKNLIDSGFISPTSCQGWYWINPKFFFKGDRYKCKELEANITFSNEE